MDRQLKDYLEQGAVEGIHLFANPKVTTTAYLLKHIV